MRPLTLATPKPLLKVGSSSLLEHLIQKLLEAGVSEFVINASYLAHQIIAALDRIDFQGAKCHVSVEETPLETGGALKRALPYLEGDAFLLVNSDVWSDIDFCALRARYVESATRYPDRLAHLVLVDNPKHNAGGDFSLDRAQLVRSSGPDQPGGRRLTFSGVSVIEPALLTCFNDERDIFPLRDLLVRAMAEQRITGEHHTGYWSDIGTPERLDELRVRHFLR